jgi:hypothetical protein
MQSMPHLTDNELTAVVGFFGAFLGAAVALIAAILTNRSNTKSALINRTHELELRRQDLNRSRGEELYTLLQKWINAIQGYYLVKGSIMSGKLTYNQGLELEIKNGESINTDHVRIQMLIEVYFPNLQTKYDQLILHRETANNIVHEHRERYRIGQTDGADFLKQLLKQQHLIGNSAAELSSALIYSLRGVFL